MLFIDFKQAFDSVDRSRITEIVTDFGIPKTHKASHDDPDECGGKGYKEQRRILK